MNYANVSDCHYCGKNKNCSIKGSLQNLITQILPAAKHNLIVAIPECGAFEQDPTLSNTVPHVGTPAAATALADDSGVLWDKLPDAEPETKKRKKDK
jgi:hypothetical protein